MENLILLGGGGHAKACLDVILSTKKYNVTGYIDMRESILSRLGIPYLGQDTEISRFVKSAVFLITVGQISRSDIRNKLYQKLKELNASLATVVSPHAYVSPFARLGEGTIIMHDALVQFNALIGANCIINDKALIEHDAQVGMHCHISTGAIINGGVVVGNDVFVGSGAIIRNGIIISNNVVVGAGSNVLKHVEENCVVVGNPAKVQKNA
jgi:sugar O-acyltransferase (sialic acid O-acetyltransferase NeuD family)